MGAAAVSVYYSDDLVTLHHGDCLSITDWLSADVLITDPPYGMSYVSGKTEARPVANDADAQARDAAIRLWGDRPALVFGTWRVTKPIGTRQVITWHKSKIGPGMGDLSIPWGSATEEVYVLGSGWHGKRRQNVIVTYEQRGNPYGLSATVGHPTPKPVGLIEQLVECSPAGLIADPFAGSGSTLLAARNQGRKVIGVEIEERYCELIANRLAQGVLL
jgi:DNA modification methylase